MWFPTLGKIRCRKFKWVPNEVGLHEVDNLNWAYETCSFLLKKLTMHNTNHILHVSFLAKVDEANSISFLNLTPIFLGPNRQHNRLIQWMSDIS